MRCGVSLSAINNIASLVIFIFRASTDELVRSIDWQFVEAEMQDESLVRTVCIPYL